MRLALLTCLALACEPGADRAIGSESLALARRAPPASPAAPLEVSSPAPRSVARPTLRFVATCRASAACNLRVSFGDSTLAEGGASLDRVIDLSSLGRSDVRLLVTASAQGRTIATQALPLHVETSPHLRVRRELAGVVLDATADRVLFAAADGLRVAPLAGGPSTLIPASAGTWLDPDRAPWARLSASGAVWTDGRDAFGGRLRAHVGSGTVELGDALPAAYGTPPVRLRGSRVAWLGLDAAGSVAVLSADLGAQRIPIVAGRDPSVQFDLADNGDVVWVTSPRDGRSDVVRVRDGVSTVLTADGPAALRTSPATDGALVVFQEWPDGHEPGPSSIVLLTPSGTTVLDPARPRPWLRGGAPYSVLGGWVAFMRSVGGREVLALRAPDGAVTTPGSERDVQLETLGPAGQAVVRARDGRRLLLQGGTTLDLGAGDGRVVWLGGVAHVLAGNAILEVTAAIEPGRPTPASPEVPAVGPHTVAGATEWRAGARAAYAIVHDDACSPWDIGQLVHAGPALARRGLRATFAAIASRCVTWPAGDELRALRRWGHEIANHSYSHVDLRAPSVDLGLEIDAAHHLLEELAGGPVRFFAFPLDAVEPRVLARLAALSYGGARGETRGVNEPGTLDPMRLSFEPYVPGGSLDDLVDRAIAAGGLALHELHGVADGSYEPVPLDDYLRHLDRLAELAERRQLWVDTPSRILSYRAALAACGAPVATGARLVFPPPSPACARAHAPLTWIVRSAGAPPRRATQSDGELRVWPLDQRTTFVEADPTAGPVSLLR